MKIRQRLLVIARAATITGAAVAAAVSAVVATGFLTPPLSAAPKSAIPWLSDVLTQKEPVAPAAQSATDTALTPIDVQPLTTDQSDGIGLLPGSITGLPRNLWQGMSALRARKRIAATRFGGVPETRALFRRLLLADATAPVGAGVSDGFILARIDRLLDIGAVLDAEALLDQIETPTPDLFRRWFDIKLLSGRGDQACGRLKDSPALSPNRAVEIFCLARWGDWDAANLTLQLAEPLGELPSDMAQLLPFFLDPGLIEVAEPPEPQGVVTPLEFVMLAAIGAPPSAETLPPAFAFVDTVPTAPVRYRMDALEGLVQKGLTDPSPLFAAYREEAPAASGGVWDRARYVQALDDATLATEIAQALVDLDRAFAPLGLRRAVAREYRRKLSVLSPREVPVAAHDLIAAYLMLTKDRPTAARWITDQSHPTLRFAFDMVESRATTPQAVAIARAFADTRDTTDPEQVGARLLAALDTLSKPPPLAPHDLSSALSRLRQIGQERVARAIAVETLLIPLDLVDDNNLD